MAKLFDKLYNRVIEGKLKLENGDDIKTEVEESLKGSNLKVKSIHGDSINETPLVTIFEKVTNANIDYTYSYVCCTQINGIMTFVVNGSFEVLQSTGSRIGVGRFKISKEIYDSIVAFDSDGTVFYGFSPYYSSAVSSISNNYIEVRKIVDNGEYYLLLRSGVPSSGTYFFRFTFDIGFAPNLAPSGD